MKKRTRVTLTVLAIVFIAILITVASQWNNIQAFKYLFLHTPDNREELRQENSIAINTAMAKAPQSTVRDLTDDELDKLKKGEISQVDIIRIITKVTEEPAAPSPQTSAPATSQPDVSNPDPTTDVQTPETETPPSEEPDKLSALLAEVYVLRAQFTISLENMVNEAKNEYLSIPDKDRTMSAKLKLGIKYLNRASSLEKECDTSMKNLITQIEAELSAVGGDMSLAEDIRSIYAQEKSLKKSEYMAIYESI